VGCIARHERDVNWVVLATLVFPEDREERLSSLQTIYKRRFKEPESNAFQSHEAHTGGLMKSSQYREMVDVSEQFSNERMIEIVQNDNLAGNRHTGRFMKHTWCAPMLGTPWYVHAFKHHI